MAIQVATKLKQWTLEELHSLPDDGNKYELVRGELFVTPAPAPDHEAVIGALNRLFVPYVEKHALGMVYQARSVMLFQGSEVEPDLMVRQPLRRGVDWVDQPVPFLVVEVYSNSTRRRDQNQKRELYLEAGVAEYWMVDPELPAVTVVRPGEPDQRVLETLTWYPSGAAQPLVVRLADLMK